MRHKTLLLIILLILFVPPFSTANTSEPEKITPIADTFVDAYNATSAYGYRDYLEVSDYVNGLSIIAIMFDISEVPDNPDPSFRAQLRLYCFNVVEPHTVSVHWCVNNTWSEEDLNFISFSEFFRTSLADIVRVDSFDTWYDWNVTNFIRTAREENYERITFALEVQDTLDGTARALFASKDQATQGSLEYAPQLVLTYTEPEPPPQNTNTIFIALGLAATVIVILLTYRFLKKRQRRTRLRKKRLKSRHRER